MPMKYRWTLRSVTDASLVSHMQRELNDLPEALARTLVLRGITDFDAAHRFFRPQLDHLHEPLLMQDMAEATARVMQAIEDRERVLVYGDYDVDGTTATALMTSFLRSEGIEADYFIPNRVDDGYGLGRAGIDAATANGATLIIALDCGITAHEPAKYAREQGIDLIICDHHTAHATVPAAAAVLDPKRPGCPYPFKELSGCGVGYKLVQSVAAQLGYDPEYALQYLDLLALSTASDIVPMHGENRVLMREGLRILKDTPRPGIRMLARQAGLDLKQCTATRIVFSLGPRINAVGRMGDARAAVELLLADRDDKAEELAEFLEKVNKERRTVDRDTYREATEQAERQITSKTRHALVLHKENWHSGVIGIVASRLVERFYKPTVILTTVNGVAKGSARSITGLNIYDALECCGDMLEQFGGHDYAAGMTLTERNIPAFRDQLNDIIGERITPELMVPTIKLDARLNLNHVDGRFWSVLKQFAPFGPDNETPLFHARDLALAGPPRTVGKDGSHLKFNVRQRDGRRQGGSLDVIGFGMGDRLSLLQQCRGQGHPLELAFCIEENHFRGRTTLQLRARDVRREE